MNHLLTSMAHAERWAVGLGGPAYAIDDRTAIKVADDTVEVVSAGHSKRVAVGSAQVART